MSNPDIQLWGTVSCFGYCSEINKRTQNGILALDQAKLVTAPRQPLNRLLFYGNPLT